MNHCKIKQNKYGSGFSGFKRDYPHGLHGVMDPREYDEMINTINSKSKTHTPKVILLFILALFGGVGMVFAGFVKQLTVLIAIGFICFGAGIIGAISVQCYFRAKYMGKLRHVIDYYNLQLRPRNITLSTREKQSKKTNQQGHRIYKLYLVIDYPVVSNYIAVAPQPGFMPPMVVGDIAMQPMMQPPMMMQPQPMMQPQYPGMVYDPYAQMQQPPVGYAQPYQPQVAYPGMQQPHMMMQPQPMNNQAIVIDKY